MARKLAESGSFASIPDPPSTDKRGVRNLHSISHSAILTGPLVSPLDISTAGEYLLGFAVEASYFQEGDWFTATALPHVTHRVRFWSVPTP